MCRCISLHRRGAVAALGLSAGGLAWHYTSPHARVSAHCPGSQTCLLSSTASRRLSAQATNQTLAQVSEAESVQVEEDNGPGNGVVANSYTARYRIYTERANAAYDEVWRSARSLRHAGPLFRQLVVLYRLGAEGQPLPIASCALVSSSETHRRLKAWLPASAQGKLEESERLFTEATRMAEKGWGDGDIHVVAANNNLSQFYTFRKEHAMAKRLQLQARWPRAWAPSRWRPCSVPARRPAPPSSAPDAFPR
jgi:hypothetical protein